MIPTVCFRAVAQVAFAALAVKAASVSHGGASKGAPVVTVANGSYYGSYNEHYHQDFFLGMPFAQPPVDDLRFRVPQPLKSTWHGIRNATQYGYECIGYGSDDWVLGNIVSEDCLTLNVIRPSHISTGKKLPVAVWIHGGGYTEGGSRDPRYNLSFIVDQSVAMGEPMIGVGINYRLSAWGFLFGREVLSSGATNLGLRDQRLALQWIHENIAAFGGDHAKVTIWGESAGARSVGAQLTAYGGRDDGLFRAAISESGSPAGYGPIPTLETWQPIYNKLVAETNCTGHRDTLACLRTIPTMALSDIFNSSLLEGAEFSPQVDGDFLRESGSDELAKGHFVKVPYLIGTNFDEGTAFGTQGINTTQEFMEAVMEDGFGLEDAKTLAALYPDIPEIGIPATLHGRPPPSAIGELGYMWKRSAAYGGDRTMHAQRRQTSQAWAAHHVDAFTYHFDVLVHGVPDYTGSTHFQEVAFVFDNIHGLGYENAVAVNPFADEPESFFRLAQKMSRMWASFVTKLDPNLHQGS